MYGNPETTPGGRALKYFASVRIDMRRIETLKNGTEMIGNRTRAKVIKNKVAPPFKEAEFDIIYGQGISKVGEIIDLAVKLELIDKAGAWFTVGETRLQGRDNVREYLEQNPEVMDRLGAADTRQRAQAHDPAGPQGGHSRGPGRGHLGGRFRWLRPPPRGQSPARCACWRSGIIPRPSSPRSSWKRAMTRTQPAPRLRAWPNSAL